MACEKPHKTKAPAAASAAVISAADIYNKPLSSLVPRSNGKYRLSKSYIRDIISLKPQALPTTDYMDSLAPLFPPEWLEEKKRQHEEEVVRCRQMNAEHEEFRREVIEAVKEKGYFEFDQEEVASMKASYEADMEAWASIDFSRVQIATPEEEILNADGYHYPDEDDDALLSEDDEVEYICSLVTED